MKAPSTSSAEHSRHFGNRESPGHGQGQQAMAVRDRRAEMEQQQGLLRMTAGSLRVQRQCSCGSPSAGGGTCAACEEKAAGAGSQALQKKLAIGASVDPLEREADRVAEQVMARPKPSALTGAALRIQRQGGHEDQSVRSAPASVEKVLAGSGTPLDSTLREDMEQRFGYDFSRVRVHSDAAAEQSARDATAYAYTVGHNIVFGADRFAPGTHEGRRLIAHELTHVVQQSGADGVRTGLNSGRSYLFPFSTTISSTRRIQRDKDLSADDPVLDLKQIGDVWHLKLKGFTDAKAVGLRIWPSGKPRGVGIVLLSIEKPTKTGLFALTGVTLKAVDSMASPFPSWFTAVGRSWKDDDLKKLLDSCDGGLGIWAKAKKANKGQDPTVSLGHASNTDSTTGEITLDKTKNQCLAVQALIHELSNLSSIADINKVIASATAGELSRDEFIKGLEKIEYDVGVKNVLSAYDACKDKWLCKDSIMEFARKAKNFEDYFNKLVLPSHKENYGKEWDMRYKNAYDKKHAKK